MPSAQKAAGSEADRPPYHHLRIIACHHVPVRTNASRLLALRFIALTVIEQQDPKLLEALEEQKVSNQELLEKFQKLQARSFSSSFEMMLGVDKRAVAESTRYRSCLLLALVMMTL